MNIPEPAKVWREVRELAFDCISGFSFDILNKCFDDMLLLFSGRFKGYKTCNVFYHDLRHTTDALLAFARLVHGAVKQGITLSEHEISIGLASSMYHDVGYLQKEGDDIGTGAKYTLVHIDRSIEFISKYFPSVGFSDKDALIGRNLLLCTGLKTDISRVPFSDGTSALLGKMLGTADLMGQMADSGYLDKLLLLYHEFLEGGIKDYANEFDLLSKTPAFYQYTLDRFERELDGINKFMAIHFKERHRIAKDLYAVCMESNMTGINYILKHVSQNSFELFKAKGLVSGLVEKGVLPPLQ